MLRGLCQPEFDVPSDMLSRFVLTIRKNYRELAYHNWKHAMTVAHSMYCILLRSGNLFSKFEKFGLLVSCLCHDIDHRGFTNDFLQKSNHPLTSLYPASTMENHHFQMTKLIVESCGHDIFSMLDDDLHKSMMTLVHDAIIATDLALYFGTQRTVKDLVIKGELNFKNPEHRLSFQK